MEVTLLMFQVVARKPRLSSYFFPLVSVVSFRFSSDRLGACFLSFRRSVSFRDAGCWHLLQKLRVNPIISRAGPCTSASVSLVVSAFVAPFTRYLRVSEWPSFLLVLRLQTCPFIFQTFNDAISRRVTETRASPSAFLREAVVDTRTSNSETRTRSE